LAASCSLELLRLDFGREAVLRGGREMASSPGDEIARRAPTRLIFDHNRDTQDALWQCLHERLQKQPQVTLIVRLKRGATYVGKLDYYETMRLILRTRTEQIEIWAREVAHVVAAAELP
jgi:hypothetical protein